MMDISFTCDNCEQHLTIDESGRGMLVACPNCGRDVLVPNRSSPPPVSETLRTANSPQILPGNILASLVRDQKTNRLLSFNQAETTKFSASSLNSIVERSEEHTSELQSLA